MFFTDSRLTANEQIPSSWIGSRLPEFLFLSVVSKSSATRSRRRQTFTRTVALLRKMLALVALLRSSPRLAGENPVSCAGCSNHVNMRRCRVYKTCVRETLPGAAGEKDRGKRLQPLPCCGFVEFVWRCRINSATGGNSSGQLCKEEDEEKQDTDDKRRRSLGRFSAQAAKATPNGGALAASFFACKVRNGNLRNIAYNRGCCRSA